MAVLFPIIDAIFGLLGGTTAVVISFIAPALFWEKFVGYMYPWDHPRKLFCQVSSLYSSRALAVAAPQPEQPSQPQPPPPPPPPPHLSALLAAQ